MSFRDIELKYRDYNFVRKPLSFEESKEMRPEPQMVPLDDAKQLGVYSAEQLEVYGPFDDIIGKVPLIFVLTYENDTYLVNTEGHNYCRYVLPCKVY